MHPRGISGLSTAAVEPAMRIFFRSVAILLAAFSCCAGKAQDAAQNPWQGEWQTADRTWGMSVRNCDASGKCTVHTFATPPGATGIGCFQAWTAAPSPGGRTLRVEAAPDGDVKCAFDIGKEGDGLRISRADGAASCKDFWCDPADRKLNRNYVLRSKLNYRTLLWRERLPVTLGYNECYMSQFKSAPILCSDPELRGIAEILKDVPYHEFDHELIMDLKIFSKCDEAPDIGACLLESFKAKLNRLQEEARATVEKLTASGGDDEAKALLAEIAGVHEHKMFNDDLLAIVPVSGTAAYIKLYLSPDYAEPCTVSGLVEYRKIGGFVFQDGSSGDKCFLTVSAREQRLTFPTGVAETRRHVYLDDPNMNCQKFCSSPGVRNRLDGIKRDSFWLATKQPVSAMPAILDLPEYRAAVARYRELHRDK
jgi:hypothetical protein